MVTEIWDGQKVKEYNIEISLKAGEAHRMCTQNWVQHEKCDLWETSKLRTDQLQRFERNANLSGMELRLRKHTIDRWDANRTKGYLQNDKLIMLFMDLESAELFLSELDLEKEMLSWTQN